MARLKPTLVLLCALLYQQIFVFGVPVKRQPSDSDALDHASTRAKRGYSSSSTTTSTSTSSSSTCLRPSAQHNVHCSYQGFFKLEDECERFLICVPSVNNGMAAYIANCPTGKQFSRSMRTCVDRQLSECGSFATETQQFTSHGFTKQQQLAFYLKKYQELLGVLEKIKELSIQEMKLQETERFRPATSAGATSFTFEEVFGSNGKLQEEFGSEISKVIAEKIKESIAAAAPGHHITKTQVTVTKPVTVTEFETESEYSAGASGFDLIAEEQQQLSHSHSQSQTEIETEAEGATLQDMATQVEFEFFEEVAEFPVAEVEIEGAEHGTETEVAQEEATQEQEFFELLEEVVEEHKETVEAESASFTGTTATEVFMTEGEAITTESETITTENEEEGTEFIEDLQTGSEIVNADLAPLVPALTEALQDETVTEFIKETFSVPASDLVNVDLDELATSTGLAQIANSEILTELVNSEVLNEAVSELQNIGAVVGEFSESVMELVQGDHVTDVVTTGTVTEVLERDVLSTGAEGLDRVQSGNVAEVLEIIPVQGVTEVLTAGNGVEGVLELVQGGGAEELFQVVEAGDLSKIVEEIGVNGVGEVLNQETVTQLLSGSGMEAVTSELLNGDIQQVMGILDQSNVASVLNEGVLDALLQEGALAEILKTAGLTDSATGFLQEGVLNSDLTSTVSELLAGSEDGDTLTSVTQLVTGLIGEEQGAGALLTDITSGSLLSEEGILSTGLVNDQLVDGLIGVDAVQTLVGDDILSTVSTAAVGDLLASEDSDLLSTVDGLTSLVTGADGEKDLLASDLLKTDSVVALLQGGNSGALSATGVTETVERLLAGDNIGASTVEAVTSLLGSGDEGVSGLLGEDALGLGTADVLESLTAGDVDVAKILGSSTGLLENEDLVSGILSKGEATQLTGFVTGILGGEGAEGETVKTVAVIDKVSELADGEVLSTVTGLVEGSNLEKTVSSLLGAGGQGEEESLMSSVVSLTELLEGDQLSALDSVTGLLSNDGVTSTATEILTGDALTTVTSGLLGEESNPVSSAIAGVLGEESILNTAGLLDDSILPADILGDDQIAAGLTDTVDELLDVDSLLQTGTVSELLTGDSLAGLSEVTGVLERREEILPGDVTKLLLGGEGEALAVPEVSEVLTDTVSGLLGSEDALSTDSITGLLGVGGAGEETGAVTELLDLDAVHILSGADAGLGLLDTENLPAVSAVESLLGGEDIAATDALLGDEGILSTGAVSGLTDQLSATDILSEGLPVEGLLSDDSGLVQVTDVVSGILGGEGASESGSAVTTLVEPVSSVLGGEVLSDEGLGSVAGILTEEGLLSNDGVTSLVAGDGVSTLLGTGEEQLGLLSSTGAVSGLLGDGDADVVSGLLGGDDEAGVGGLLSTGVVSDVLGGGENEEGLLATTGAVSGLLGGVGDDETGLLAGAPVSGLLGGDEEAGLLQTGAVTALLGNDKILSNGAVGETLALDSLLSPQSHQENNGQGIVHSVPVAGGLLSSGGSHKGQNLAGLPLRGGLLSHKKPASSSAAIDLGVSDNDKATLGNTQLGDYSAGSAATQEKRKSKLLGLGH